MIVDGEGRIATSPFPAVSHTWYVGFVSLCLIILGSLLLLLKAVTRDGFNQMAVYLVFFACVPIVAAFGTYYGARDANRIDAHFLRRRQVERLGLLLPPAVLFFGLWGIDQTLYHAAYEHIIDPAGFGSSGRRFFLGSLTAGLLAIGFMMMRALRLPFGISGMPEESIRFAYVLLAIFLLSLFKTDLGHDSLSYDPYSGPASAVALGAIPMVDVFSQYGLNYLLLTAGLKLLPWSMYSMSLVVTILDLLYYFVVVLICIKLSKDKILALALSVFLIFFLASAALYNPSYTPSAGAMRYLPSMLLLLALCHVRHRAFFSRAVVFALCLSSLWSLEAAIFSCVTCSVYVLGVSIGERPFSLRPLVLRLLLLGGLVLAPHAILAIGYVVFLGTAPRYDIYFQLVLTQTKSSSWIVSADPAVRTWVIFGFTYALALAYALFGACASLSPSRLHRHAVVASVAALGIMQFSYYAGRAVTPVLVFLAFPLLILFVLFMDDCAELHVATNANARTRQWIHAGLVVVLLVACGGVIGDRFFREPYVLRSNATLLRRCLDWEPGRPHCLKGFARGIRDKLRQPAGFVLPEGLGVTDKDQASWQLIPTGMTLENTAAYLLARKWLSEQEQIFLFIPDAATVLFALKKRNALGLTHSMVDDRSSLLRTKAMEAAERITDGTIIMVGDMAQQAIEREIYAYLRSRWVFEWIDGGHSVVVYKLRARAERDMQPAIVSSILPLP